MAKDHIRFDTKFSYWGGDLNNNPFIIRCSVCKKEKLTPRPIIAEALVSWVQEFIGDHETCKKERP